MKRSLKNMIGFTVQAVDGPKGKVKDFLFDEERWILRYLEVDYGNLFQNKRVLIPGFFLNEPDWEKKHLPVRLNQSDIEACPDLEERMPVSREYEKLLSKHYDINYYWLYTESTGMAMYFPTRPIRTPSKIVDEKDLETNLRSFKEVQGYHIRALNGKLGHIDDIIVDDKDLQIVYLIVDTSNWLPWSKKVLLAISWLEEISYLDQEVSINLHTETIKNAPEFNPDHPIEDAYEKNLFDFYSRSLVK